MKLVIFDLDQTLVDFIKVHDKAVNTLFKRYFGIDAWLTEIDFAGRSLTDSFITLAKKKNLPEDEVRNKLSEMLADYDRVFIAGMPGKAEEKVLPGPESFS